MCFSQISENPNSTSSNLNEKITEIQVTQRSRGQMTMGEQPSDLAATQSYAERLWLIGSDPGRAKVRRPHNLAGHTGSGIAKMHVSLFQFISSMALNTFTSYIPVISFLPFTFLLFGKCT